MNFGQFDLHAIALFLILILFFPIRGFREYRLFQSWIREGRLDARVKIYTWTLVTQWGLTVVFVSWWLLNGRTIKSLGLIPTPQGWQWLAIGLGVAGMIIQVLQMFRVVGNQKQLDQIREQSMELCHLAPKTSAENRLFSLVSITAGICEEILYRGLLMAILIPTTGTWVAVVLTSVIFGLGHAYQGWQGVVKTGVIGSVFALLFVFSGSLVVPILLHAIVDLTAGRMLRAATKDPKGSI